MKYDVHIFANARIKVPDIEADSQEQAIRKAETEVDVERFLSFDRNGYSCEWDDEISGYLVDEQGDKEYRNTHVYRQEEGEIIRDDPNDKPTDSKCPKCGDEDITGDSYDTEGPGMISQRLSCNACDAEWRVYYRIDEVDVGEATP